MTWFVTECTAAVRGRMNPATDTPHCDITDAQAIRVSSNGHRFGSHYRLRTGIIGDGYCGHGRARHLRHRRRDRPGTGHRRAHHVQDAAGPVHLDDQHDRPADARSQASWSHSRWLKPMIRPRPTPTASFKK